MYGVATILLMDGLCALSRFMEMSVCCSQVLVAEVILFFYPLFSSLSERVDEPTSIHVALQEAYL